MSRIPARFAALKAENRAGLVTFITACDPDRATAQALLNGMPQAGADLIELGMPFSDPMADGPAIQFASQRALKNGGSLPVTLEMVAEFRKGDDVTPLILMGYYNPVYSYGVEAFCRDAASAGVDGLIIVDLPPEEAEELAGPARAQGIDFIFLTTPTTDAARLPAVLETASGFIYYVSIAGITGTASAAQSDIAAALAHLRGGTDLPLAVGFGIKTPDAAAEVARLADAVVVGSAIVSALAAGLDEQGVPADGLVDRVLAFVGQLAGGVRQARCGLQQEEVSA